MSARRKNLVEEIALERLAATEEAALAQEAWGRRRYDEWRRHRALADEAEANARELERKLKKEEE